MTYILPDDWYANHGLAPGDARGRQPILQPRVGNLAPVPPMRGYFGKPPVSMLRFPGTTLSPFATPDVMWGVNGLGEESLDDRINKIFSDMEEEQKKKMMAVAAASTAAMVTLAVTFPVVGTIIAAVASIVMGITQGKYQNEAKEIMAKCQATLQVMANDYKLAMDAADNAIIEQLKPAAVQLAVSNQSLAGFPGLGDFWSKAKKVVKKIVSTPFDDLKNTLDKIGLDAVVRQMEKVEEAGQDALDLVSGRSAVVEAREARDKALREAQAEFDRVLSAHMQGLQDPVFQRNMIVQMAKQLRADPSFRAVAGTGISEGAAKGGVMAAAGVTAAIVAFAALKGS